MAKRLLGGVLALLVSAGASGRALHAATFPVPSSESAYNWTFTLEPAHIIDNKLGLGTWEYLPDARTTVLPDGHGKFMMFWAEATNYRSVGSGPFLEDQERLEPPTPVLAGVGAEIYPEDTYNKNNFDNGGTWISSAFRQDGDKLIGFSHTEYNYAEDADGTWMSMAVIYSSDNGFTWSKAKKILSESPIPDEPTWGGAGEGSVVWDQANARWVAFWGGMRLAISTDPNGAPGTWFKYYKGAFTEPGIDGKSSWTPGIPNGEGTSPSVHWNTYLQLWIMVNEDHAGPIRIRSSKDLIHWDTSRILVPGAFSSDGGEKASTWSSAKYYPTIIGSESDVVAGQSAQLYYGGPIQGRTFTSRKITFSRSA